MKTTLRVFFCILAVLAFAGCPETKVGPDFGYKFLILRPSEWNGIWKTWKVKPKKDGSHSRIDSDPANYRVLVQPEFWSWMDPTIVQRQCREK